MRRNVIIPFPYLDDASQKITREYGATNTPHVFVLQKVNGKPVVRYTGAIDNNADDATQATKHYVADAVNALIASTSRLPSQRRKPSVVELK